MPLVVAAKQLAVRIFSRRSNETRLSCHITCSKIDRGMKKMIIGGFLPLKNFPGHWSKTKARPIGGHYRAVGPHMTDPSLASAVFILLALARTLGCLPLLLSLDKDPQVANP